MLPTVGRKDIDAFTAITSLKVGSWIHRFMPETYHRLQIGCMRAREPIRAVLVSRHAVVANLCSPVQM